MPNSYPTPNEANTTSMKSLGYSHPGRVTRGPAGNKPRIHLVSSKGKIPAAVYAQAIALKQKQNSLVNPSGSNGSQSSPGVTSHPQNQQALPHGVKPHHKDTRPSGGVG